PNPTPYGASYLTGVVRRHCFIRILRHLHKTGRMCASNQSDQGHSPNQEPGAAMKLIDPFIAEFEHEAGSTRKMLEIVPQSGFDWKPHEKSMTLGKLATHIAEIPGWIPTILDQTELVLTADYRPTVCATPAEVLALFDKNIADAKKSMESKMNEEMFIPW